jgi:hypothetical protein
MDARRGRDRIGKEDAVSRRQQRAQVIARGARRVGVAAAQRDAGRHIADIGHAGGVDMAACCQIVDQLARQDDKIGRLAADDAVAHAAHGAEIAGEPLACRRFDLPRQRLGQPLCGTAAQHLQHSVSPLSPMAT